MHQQIKQMDSFGHKPPSAETGDTILDKGGILADRGSDLNVGRLPTKRYPSILSRSAPGVKLYVDVGQRAANRR